jgi:hypothetical protein
MTRSVTQTYENGDVRAWPLGSRQFSEHPAVARESLYINKSRRYVGCICLPQSPSNGGGPLPIGPGVRSAEWATRDGPCGTVDERERRGSFGVPIVSVASLAPIGERTAGRSGAERGLPHQEEVRPCEPFAAGSR